MRSRILAALLLVGLALGASSARADVTLGMYCTVASASTIDFPASGTSPTDNAFTVDAGTVSSTGLSTCTITLAYAWVWNHATFTDNDSTVVPEIRADFHGNAAAVAVDHSGATVTSSTTGTCPSCTTTITITATGSTKLDGAEIGITLF